MDEPRRTQPEPAIPGGATRPSTHADRSAVPGVAARERVLKVLRAHDLDTRDEAWAHLDEADVSVIRIIAQEGAASNTEPSVRYSAIAALAERVPVENLNLLSDLASFGEDFYVRGHALLAMGASGLQLTIPLIAIHLRAQDQFERLAAGRAIELLARNGSQESVLAYASLGGGEVRAAVAEVLEQSGKLRRAAHGRPRSTARHDVESQ
jgi:hypothetical protein